MTADANKGAIESVDMIRALALSCPGVAAMSPTARTYLPGRSVVGVVVDEQVVTVHVIAVYGAPLAAIGQRLGSMLSSVLAGRDLQVHIDDIVLPAEALAAGGIEISAMAGAGTPGNGNG